LHNLDDSLVCDRGANDVAARDHQLAAALDDFQLSRDIRQRSDLDWQRVDFRRTQPIPTWRELGDLAILRDGSNGRACRPDDKHGHPQELLLAQYVHVQKPLTISKLPYLRLLSVLSMRRE
jgi:hypothetical protein